MKIQVETDEKLKETEVVIRCPANPGQAKRIQAEVMSALRHVQRLEVNQGGKNFYLAPEDFIFFEVVDSQTFAHTGAETYQIRSKLYELEESLPASFVRASKSTIIGVRHILSIRRNLTGPSLVQFRDSHKQINVSRSYFKQLRNKLNERSIIK